jgi:hypothetical protein
MEDCGLPQEKSVRPLWIQSQDRSPDISFSSGWQLEQL